MTKLIPLQTVQNLIGGLSQPTIWRMRRAGKFPEPIQISPGRKAWLESDVIRWVETRINASTPTAT